jgi:hypothetical protein
MNPSKDLVVSSSGGSTLRKEVDVVDKARSACVSLRLIAELYEFSVVKNEENR